MPYLQTFTDEINQAAVYVLEDPPRLQMFSFNGLLSIDMSTCLSAVLRARVCVCVCVLHATPSVR